MNLDRIQSQLSDLPAAFLPGGSVGNALWTAFAAGLSILGFSTNALYNQMNMSTASANWLTVWGTFFGISRNPGEDDAEYYARITNSLQGWASTPNGIAGFIENVYGVPVEVAENLVAGTYQIKFLSPVSNGTLNNIAVALGRIRPAGVPFLPFQIVTTGTFLDTNAFLGMSLSTGGYLAGSTSGYTPPLPGNTNQYQVSIAQQYINLPVF